MVATLTDLSRRGDTGVLVLPEVFSSVDGLLRSWMATANAQNPTQLLSVERAPGEVPGFTGWVIRARLSALNSGQPVELMSQWVANLSQRVHTWRRPRRLWRPHRWSRQRQQPD
jgi:hypothetical protein